MKTANNKYSQQHGATIKKIVASYGNWYLPCSGIWNERYMSEKKDVLTKSRNLKELKIIQSNLAKKTRSILDAPCGYGRISSLLAAKGYNVTGVDINKYFVDIAKDEARKKKLSVQYYIGDILKKKIHGKYDAVLNIFTSIGYLESEKKNELFIKKLCSYVKPGGQLIIETMNPIALFRRFKKVSKVITSDGKRLAYTRYFDYKTATIVTEVKELKSNKVIFKGAHIIRLYFPHELIAICKKYGCSLHVLLDKKGKECDLMDSFRMWLIFNKSKTW